MNISDWISAQSRVLTREISRMQIVDLEQEDIYPQSTADLSIRMWRNFACEPMEKFLQLVSGYWGITTSIEYSSYDDALTFAGWRTSVAETIEVIALDRSYYKSSDQEFSAWLTERQRHLENICGSKPLSVVLSDRITFFVGEEQVSSIEPEDFERPLFDGRYTKSTGSRLAPHTHIAIARELGSTWIPERIVPPKKLLVLDLDNTLHRGVFGEIGMKVSVDSRAHALQEEVLRAKRAGYLLAVISKNDARDIETLFADHPDYLLRRDDFVEVIANWNQKSQNLEKVLELTRIGSDAVVFVDDNPVELILMTAAFPKVTVIAAGEDADAHTSLRNVPGYRRSTSDDLAEIRTRDLLTNREREDLIKGGLSEYYQSAQPVLSVSVNNPNHLNRLVDLGRRSNQFNLRLARSNEQDFATNDRISIALGLSDKFSESGIIGGILLQPAGGSVLDVVELFMSCRVLGRELETPLIAAGLVAGLDLQHAEEINVQWVIGERNEPALAWLGRVLLGYTPVGPGSLTLSRRILVELAALPEGVSIHVS